MNTKYLCAHSYLLAVLLFMMVFAPSAQAVTNTPLDCPGVIAVGSGYRLTQNTTCNFTWSDNDKVFDLDNFTLKGGPGVVEGKNLTIRNGVLQTNGMNWQFAENGTLSGLVLKSGPQPLGFFIEAGSNFTAQDCVFKDIPRRVIDFYFGNIGAVKNSVFIGNDTGISIQKSSHVVIERNTFINNIKGVNLWDELGAEVNNNTVRRNFFHNNQIGINMLAVELLIALDGTSAMHGNRIVDNRISDSGLSGIYINAACFRTDPTKSPACPAQNTVVSGNHLLHNGFQSVSGIINDNDDGLTARASIFEFGAPETPYPQGLAGVTLSNNRAEKNADLGFDVYGVTDGGGQIARANGDQRQCVGVRCDSPKVGLKSKSALPSRAALSSVKKKRFTAADFASALRQYRHDPE